MRAFVTKRQGKYYYLARMSGNNYDNNNDANYIELKYAKVNLIGCLIELLSQKKMHECKKKEYNGWCA